MTYPTCNVLCKVVSDDGTPLEGVLITAVLNRYEVYNGYIVPEYVEATTDSNGSATLKLWPNALGATASMYNVIIYAGNKPLKMTTVVPNVSNANLHEISTLPVYPGLTDGQLILTDAVNAGATAVAKAIEAAASAAAASSSASTASSAQVAVAVDAAIASTKAGIATTKAAEAAASATDAANSADTAVAQAAIAITKATLTANDRIQTGLDCAATAADRVQTGLDKVATDADVVLTHADVVSTHADKAQTAADRIQTNLDRIQTGADRIATALSASDANSSKVAATTQAASALSRANEAAISAAAAADSASAAASQATNATTQAGAASTSATNAETSATAAAGSATSAATSASSATNSAAAAATSATAAAGSNTAAAAQASAAAGSASSALAIYGSIAAINTAVSTSTTNANNAATSATNAANSATAAAASAASAAAIVTGVSSNRPSVRPSLLIDFAAMGKLDPRITFGRASSALAYDGKTTVKAEENLVLYSGDFSNAAWLGKTYATVTGNAAVAPDGTTTASKWVEDSSTNARSPYQGASFIAGQAYTFSVFAKDAGRQLQFLFDGTAFPADFVNFDLANGKVAYQSSSNVITSISPVGNGWYRCTATITATANNASGRFYIAPAYSTVRSSTYAGDGVSGFYLWGFQLEQRAYATAYTPTTTAAITNYIPALQSYAANVARFDFNPVTGESLGLMVEEQRTNLLSYSQQFDVPYAGANTWGKSNAAPLYGVAIAPDGTFTASKIIEDGTTGTHYIWQQQTTTAQAYTFSVYAKAGERTRLGFREDQTGASALFDLSAGTVANTTGSGFTATITPVGNGWYRCTMSGTYAAASTRHQLYVQSSAATAGNSSYAGNGYSGVYLWGAQLEAGAFATSYIPTLLTYSGRGSVGTYIGDNGLIQTAAANVPRYQRNIAGAVQLLLEGAASNLMQWTSNFAQWYWTPTTGAKVLPRTAVAPDGTYTADTLIYDGSGTAGTYRLYTSGPVSVNAQTYTTSVWLRANSPVTIRISGNGVSGGLVTCNLTTQWQRFQTTGTGNGASYVQLIVYSNTSDNSALNIQLWGVQIETGSVATSYIPSTETFTSRSSTATYYDSGTTALAEQNLVLYSQVFGNSAWTKHLTVVDNATVAPDGTSTAASLTPSASTSTFSIFQAASVMSSTHTHSMYVKANGYKMVMLRESRSGGQWAGFDVSAGTVVGSSGGVSPIITSVGNGWYRISATFSIATTTRISLYVLPDTYTGDEYTSTWTADGTSGVYVWGAQVELRSSVSAYTVTTSAYITNYIPRLLTAPSGLARYDFDPVTRLSKGLLVEAAATNLLVYSSSQNAADWVKNGCSIAADAVIAPDGTLTADAIVEDTSAGNHRIYQRVVATSGATYTASLYVKANTITQISLMETTSGGVLFNLSALTASGSTPYTMTPVGNGWYRLSITFVSPGDSLVLQVRLYKAGQVSYTGDGISSAYVWGAQVELGSVATSYIPTTSAQVTRAADSATSVANSRAADVWSSAQATRSGEFPSMTGANFSQWYRQDQGTFLISGQTVNSATASTYNYLNVSDGTANNMMQIAGTGREVVDTVVLNGSSLLQVYNGFKATYPFTFVNALAYNNNDFQAYNKGSSLGSATAGRVPVLNRLDIGCRYDGAVHAGQMTIKRLAFYPQRLIAAEQAGLTS